MDDVSVATNRVRDPRTFARKYQLELCKRAVEENVIVCLETGCGKTLIAVLLMLELSRIIRKPSESICVFLAPTNPLVRQQAMVIENSTDFKVHCHYKGHGNLKDHDDWKKVINQYEVLVMTPEIFLYTLHHCLIRMDLVALLIFDECHHAQKNTRHPYVQIMKEFYKTGCEKSPRIFGMTASPIIGKGGTDQLNYAKSINSLENLLDAKMFTVNDKSELESFVASPHTKVYYYGPVFYTASSLTVAYFKKLDEIKWQCISMIKDELCDPKKTKKMIQNFHDDILFCLEHVGLVGAIKAAQILLPSDKAGLLEMEAVTVNGGNCLAYQYLTKAMSVLHGNLSDDSGDADSLPFEAIEEPFYSKKLSVLIQLLASYRLKADMKCIVFVKRNIVAKSLVPVLGSVPSLDFWKCEFLVGFHSGYPGSKSKSRRVMNDIVEKFSSGEVNLLVATNVAEEGLDIQTCGLVVRFDLPETVASFIQSRGRARMKTSEYVFLVERENERQQKLLHDLIAGEQMMNDEITNRTSNDTYDGSVDHIYTVDSTGASISTSCSVSLLHRYCDKLPRDLYFTPKPEFFYMDDPNGTICRIILPANSPIRWAVSQPCTSKDEAKRNVCLKVCKELHERGALTDYLLPGLTGSQKIGSGANHFEYNGKSNEDDSLREELYEMLVPAVLRGSWNSNDISIDMHSYYIRFVPKPPDRQYRMFGLFITNPLPKEAENLEVDLHLAHGRIVKTGLMYQGIITFNKEEIVLAQNFQEMFFKIILDRSEFCSDFVPLGTCNVTQDCSSNWYLLLPVTQVFQKRMNIDWTTVARCLSSQTFTNMTSACEKVTYCTNDTLQFLNGPVNKADVINSLVFTPHNSTFYFIDEILDDTNAYSHYKDGTYAQYYCNKNIEISYPEQPFLKAKQLFVCRNLLHNRIQQNTEARELMESFVELPPEHCVLKIIGFSKDIGSSLSLLPSFMHRLENFLVAVELKDVLSSSFPEASKIRANSILEALTTEKCMERFSLERFEVLGDSFLKYAVARHSFLTYEALDEGQLTKKRSSIVNNSNLFELAVGKELQVYIHDEVFDPAQFFVLGRPCKKVCNLDTQLLIHKRGSKNMNVGDEGYNVRCTKSHQWLHRGSIADVVEALVGAFLVDSGFKAAVAFLSWIGIPVDFDISDLYRVWDLSNANLSLIRNTNVNALEEILGYTFRCKGLLIQAIVHPSYNKHSGGCYQKLEFLGDAVLEYLITSYLYSIYSELKPGQITDLRSSAVNNNSFANIAVLNSIHNYLIQDSHSLTKRIAEFERFVHLSDLEKDLHEEPACPKVLGDIVESCVGAVLLDSGLNLNIVWRVMLTLLKPALDFSSLQISSLRELRELCQYFNFALRFPEPIITERGYDVKVEVDLKDKQLICKSTNRSSKSARRMAAQKAISWLKTHGYKDKNKSLEEILLSAKKGKPELIGFDEEPIKMDSVGSISLEQQQTQIPEEIPQVSGFKKENDVLQSNCNGICYSSRMDSTRAKIHGSCNGSNDQIEQPMGPNEKVNGIFSLKTPKSQLVEICAAKYWSRPLFQCCKDEGACHQKMFTYKVTVEVKGSTPVHMECFSEPRPQKKAAQDHAATAAIWFLKHLGYVH